MTTIPELINEFNRKVKLLVLNIYNKDKKNEFMYRMKERVINFCDISPVHVIDGMGKGLYLYKDIIYKADEDFALNHDFLSELPKNIKDIHEISVSLKHIWVKLTKNEKENFIYLVQELLDDYIEYMSLKHL